MSAMQLVHEAQAAGGNVVSFKSVCGGLPAPEAANNPLRYKFSWSPRGVLSAAMNSSKYIEGGEVREVDGSSLLANAFPFHGISTLALEQLPNRDSTPYREAYGLQTAHTVYRGTLRYRGTCDRLLALQTLGLLDDSALSSTLSSSWDALLPPDQATAFYGDCTDEQRETLQWLKNSCDQLEPVPGEQHESKLDCLGVLLARLPALQYKPGERDMAAMQHELLVEYDAYAAAAAGLSTTGQSVVEKKTSQLLLYHLRLFIRP